MSVLVGFTILLMLLLLAYMIYRLVLKRNLPTLVTVCLQIFSISSAIIGFLYDVEAVSLLQGCYVFMGIAVPSGFLVIDYRVMVRKISEKGTYDGFIERREINPDERMPILSGDNLNQIKKEAPPSEVLKSIFTDNSELIRNIKNLLLHIHSAINKKEYEKALESYSLLAALFKHSIGILFNLGNLYYVTERYKEAAQSYERALETVTKEKPSEKEMPNNAGSGDAANTDSKSAAETCEQCISTAAILYNLGNTCFKLGKFEKAIEAYKKSLEIDSGLQEAEENTAFAYFNLGEKEKALELYDSLLEKEPENIRVLHSLGRLHEETENFDKALEIYQKCLALSPESAEILYKTGRLYLKQGRYKDAAADYEKLERLKPGDYKVLMGKGSACYRSGRLEAASKAYKKAIELNPENYRAYFNLASVLDESGSSNEAAETLRKVIGLKPDFIEAYNNLGIILSTAGRHDEAIAVYEKALRENPSEYSLYYNMGITLTETDRYGEAAEAYRNALELHPDDYELYCHLGASLVECRRYDEAAEIYKKAMKIKPSDSELFYSLATVYSLLRKHDIAVDNLRRAIELNEQCRKDARSERAFDGMRTKQEFKELLTAKS